MEKILILTLIFIGNSFNLNAQTTDEAFETNQIIKLACSDIPLNPTFILKIKGYELSVQGIEDIIEPAWIKSIEVVRNSKSLIDLGYKERDTLVILELKNRFWKKLPQYLKDDGLSKSI